MGSYDVAVEVTRSRPVHSIDAYRASPYSGHRAVGRREHQEGDSLWGSSLKTIYHRGFPTAGAAWENQAKGRTA